MTNKTDTSVVGLIKEKREKAQINNEKRELMRERFFFFSIRNNFVQINWKMKMQWVSSYKIKLIQTDLRNGSEK